MGNATDELGVSVEASALVLLSLSNFPHVIEIRAFLELRRFLDADTSSCWESSPARCVCPALVFSLAQLARLARLARLACFGGGGLAPRLPSGLCGGFRRAGRKRGCCEWDAWVRRPKPKQEVVRAAVAFPFPPLLVCPLRRGRGANPLGLLRRKLVALASLFVLGTPHPTLGWPRQVLPRLGDQVPPPLTRPNRHIVRPRARSRMGGQRRPVECQLVPSARWQA